MSRRADVALPTGEAPTAELQPYHTEGSTFERIIVAERNKAARLVSDLDADIDRLEAELEERRRRKSDNELIVARCDAALGLQSVLEATANRTDQ